MRNLRSTGLLRTKSSCVVIFLLIALLQCTPYSNCASDGIELAAPRGQDVEATDDEAPIIIEPNQSLNISDESSFGLMPRSTRRSLLPSGTIIKDEHQQLLSHVVRIKSQSNGVGTGVLLKTNYVLTAKRVVKAYLDPFEFTIVLGNEIANGLDVFVHPSEDLAVIKVHPPLENTGKLSSPFSSKGFFWPLAKEDPKPGSTVKVFGYGGTFSYGSKNYLSFKSFSVSGKSSSNHLVLSTKASIPTTSGDAGGPALLMSNKNRAVLVGVVTASKPRQGALVSIAQHRDWVFAAMKSTCSREEQTFMRLLVDTDPDILIYYHCKVERAERLGIHINSKPAPCTSAWKAVLITNKHGNVIAKVDTHDKKDKDSVILSSKMLKSSTEFYIELWKPKLLGMHTMVAKYGPFNVSDHMDGGLHFEWCAS